MGKLFLDQQYYEVALASLLLAKNILNEIQSSYYDESQRGIDTLRKVVGEEEFAILLAKVEPQAQNIVEQGLNAVEWDSDLKRRKRCNARCVNKEKRHQER